MDASASLSTLATTTTSDQAPALISLEQRLSDLLREVSWYRKQQEDARIKEDNLSASLVSSEQQREV
jgi:hypothetical protein